MDPNLCMDPWYLGSSLFRWYLGVILFTTIDNNYSLGSVPCNSHGRTSPRGPPLYNLGYNVCSCLVKTNEPRDSYFQLLLKNDGLHEQVFLLSLFNVILSAFMCHLNSSIANYLMLNQEDLKLDGTAENKYLWIILI